MAIMRCKMCGGNLEVIQGSSICTCEFCGTQQTIPTVTDEGLQALFNRANVLRMKSEFDKAAEVYEKILQRSETEAEAYWGLILCKFGVEYVEDPTTFKRIPTCHRTSFDAIVSDEDYKNAITYADTAQKTIYESEAIAIDEIQKGIIALAQNEDPYDVFICYKETDDSDKRTPDSVIANDIYYQLTQEGFKVFFAAISLEDKLGVEYEPYIFSALNTAKVMLALGTKPEYFNAVWVKNEWSRYLKIMKQDRSKLLIPCYRDMDPYELPEEFAHLQAQDMSKIGFLNDIVRGIKKVLFKDNSREAVMEPIPIQQNAGNTTATAQIQRGNIALEDHEWEKADNFFEEALNLDPHSSAAYIGKMLARDRKSGFDSWLIDQIGKYRAFTTERLEACLPDNAHVSQVLSEMTVKGYLEEEAIKQLYECDLGFDSMLSCRKEQKQKLLGNLSSDRLLNRAKQYADGNIAKMIDDAISEINAILDKRISEAEEQDAQSIERVTQEYASHIENADLKTKNLNHDAQKKRDQDIKRQKEAAEDAKQRIIAIGCLLALAVVCVAAFLVVTRVILPQHNYKNAIALMEGGEYKAAINAFEELDNYKDSKDQVTECYYNLGLTLMEGGEYKAAIDAFELLDGYKDSKNHIAVCHYNWGLTLMANEEYGSAIDAFSAADGYMDSDDMLAQCWNEMFYYAQVGDVIRFGVYEQDNDTSNGKEEIEWLVLAKEDSHVFILSNYALACQQYNDSKTSVTWETCSLRMWLNNTFLNDAFSAEEKNRIIATTVSPDANPEHPEVSSGNITQDYVFLLSIDEANKYLSTDEARKCVPKAAAISQGVSTTISNTADREGSCSWWLRSPGYAEDYVACVKSSGSIINIGVMVNEPNRAVRPAMWIDISNN